MCLLSISSHPFTTLRNPIPLRRRPHTSGTHLSLSGSPSPPTFARADHFLLFYRGSHWSASNWGRCRAGAGIGVLLHDAGATGIVLAGAYGLVLGFDKLTQHNIIQKDSTSMVSRFFAALVPLVNCFRLLIHGLSLVSNEGLIQSVTREGKPEELLRGPLYYVLMLIFCAIIFWRESPIGIISISMMCAGDGIADIMGRKFGSTKISYNRKKSWEGSISMFVFGFLASIGMLYYFSVLGYFEFDWAWMMPRVALVSLVATMIESLPITEAVDDNISVPLASMAAAYLSFN